MEPKQPWHLSPCFLIFMCPQGNNNSAYASHLVAYRLCCIFFHFWLNYLSSSILSFAVSANLPFPCRSPVHPSLFSGQLHHSSWPQCHLHSKNQRRHPIRLRHPQPHLLHAIASFKQPHWANCTPSIYATTWLFHIVRQSKDISGLSMKPQPASRWVAGISAAQNKCEHHWSNRYEAYIRILFMWNIINIMQ